MRFSGPPTIAAVTAGAMLIVIAAPAFAADDPRPIPAKIAITKVDKNTGVGKLTKFVSRAPKGSPYSIPAFGSADDPRTAGGTFRRCVTSGTTLTDWTPIPLLASGWKGLGNPAGSKGWKYKGAGTVADPCRVVLIKEKVIKAVCKGAGAVDPMFLLPIGGDSVSDELTSGDIRYCMQHDPPNFIKDDASRGLWKSKNAAAPSACLALCGNGVVEGAEECDDGNSTPGDGCENDCTLTPPPYGSASRAFLAAGESLFD